MENLSDVQLKRCVAWMRLEFLAWICLCADALVSVWAPSVWDTGHIYGLFVVVVLVSVWRQWYCPGCVIPCAGI